MKVDLKLLGQREPGRFRPVSKAPLRLVRRVVPSDSSPSPVILATVLPGPSRKRVQSPYLYRLTYFNSDLEGAGCLTLWEVQGGRMAYQIAVEREESGRLRCHCTCADAVFRAEEEGRICKHVQGLLDLGRQLSPAEQSPELPARLGA